MKYIGRFFLGFGFCGFVFLAPLNLAAQNGQAQEPGRQAAGNALIYHVEGEDFALTLRGEQTIYTAEAVRKERVELKPSGIVNTGAGTFLEIQLIPSGTVLKLSENTSLVYNGIDESGSFVDLGILYGRIRVVTGAQSVVIRGGGVSARVWEGDFAADYILEPGWNSASQPQLRLYMFRGSAEVFPYGKGSSERKPTDGNIVAYWNNHKFAGTPPAPMPDTVIAMVQGKSLADIAGGASSVETDLLQVSASVAKLTPDESSTNRLEASVMSRNRGKTVIMSVGLGLILSTVTVQAISYYSYDLFSDHTARAVHTGAYGALGLGLFLSLIGIVYNPLSPVR